MNTNQHTWHGHQFLLNPLIWFEKLPVPNLNLKCPYGSRWQPVTQMSFNTSKLKSPFESTGRTLLNGNQRSGAGFSILTYSPFKTGQMMLGMTATLINDSAVVTMIVWQTYEYDDETLDLHTSSAQPSVYACCFSSAWSQCCCRLAISVSNIAIEIECRRGEKEEASRADVFSLLVVKCAPRASHIFTWPHSQLCRRAFECARACFILILSTRTGYRRTVCWWCPIVKLKRNESVWPRRSLGDTLDPFSKNIHALLMI